MTEEELSDSDLALEQKRQDGWSLPASFKSSFAPFREAMSSNVIGFSISSISSSIALTKDMSEPTNLLIFIDLLPAPCVAFD